MAARQRKLDDIAAPGAALAAEAYAGGFTAGLLQAVQTLRIYAGQHTAASAGSTKIAESEGNAFAARLLRSYANGLEMDAERFASGSAQPEPKAATTEREEG